MNLFTRNIPYHHLLKHLLFLLKHPVYYECVFVNLGVQQAMLMHHIAMCGLPDFNFFFHIIS
jgi:hypothetical protein